MVRGTIGAESFALIFNKIFTGATDDDKYIIAPWLLPYYRDLRAQMDCDTDVCDALTDKKAALDAAITAMLPYETPPGGGV